MFSARWHRSRSRSDRDQPSRRASGRSLSDFAPLTLAEEQLLVATAAGAVARIADDLPEVATKENTIRATFLRFLMLGGDTTTAVHEKGPQPVGAYICGVLDLESAPAVRALDCLRCRFETALVLRDGTLPGVYLIECHVPGISADRAVIHGSVILANGFTATGAVLLRAVRIDGNLDCTGGKFHVAQGLALAVDRGIIGGSVYLRHGFTATGEVRLLGAEIGSNLECDASNFEVREGDSLSADGAVISGALFVRRLAKPLNNVRLHGVSVGRLLDDAEAWGSNLFLDGFRYGILGNEAPTDAATRIAWLNKQTATHVRDRDFPENFRPQPWKHLQKILRAMGHAEEARQVGVAFEHKRRALGLVGDCPKTWGLARRILYRRLSLTLHFLYWMLIGYGMRPLRLLGWIFLVWAVGAALYWWAASSSLAVFAPSNPIVFQHPAYAVCEPNSAAADAERQRISNAIANKVKREGLVPPAISGAGNWYLCEKLRGEYTGFSPMMYSLDVLLPLVDLQQERDWAPMIPTPKAVWSEEALHFTVHHVVRIYVWLQILFGWTASLLLVAIVSGLAKREESPGD